MFAFYYLVNSIQEQMSRSCKCRPLIILPICWYLLGNIYIYIYIFKQNPGYRNCTSSGAILWFGKIMYRFFIICVDASNGKLVREYNSHTQTYHTHLNICTETLTSTSLTKSYMLKNTQTFFTKFIYTWNIYICPVSFTGCLVIRSARPYLILMGACNMRGIACHILQNGMYSG